MTTFLRLLQDADKATALQQICRDFRAGRSTTETFEVDVSVLKEVPGSPFAYWISANVRSVFKRIPPFEAQGRTARAGLQTSDDFRFLRANWETEALREVWVPLAKGGTHSPFYADVFLVVKWAGHGKEIANFCNTKTGEVISYIRNSDFYFRPGLFQTLRAARLAPHLTPPGCIFGDNGTQAFSDSADLLAILCILNSGAADSLHKLLLGRAGFALYRNGTLSRLPTPSPGSEESSRLSEIGRESWLLRRRLDTVNEVSHAFVLPTAIRDRVGDYEPTAIQRKLACLQEEIDEIVFNLYGFNEVDRAAVQASQDAANEDDAEVGDDAEADDDTASGISQTNSLISWAVGVAFGRFDFRLATGERAMPPEPEPFDPLPRKSPGMLPDGAAPFHVHPGILVDDAGHPQDLVSVLEDVLSRVDIPAHGDLRHWLQKDFFTFHLQRYSKSRRKAPIYWPLSTVSGSYTLWMYYPSLTRQTLYTAINDFVEPKLKQVDEDVNALRNKDGARTPDEEKQFEALQTLAQELSDLRDTLQGLAQNYQPNHDDGVQITAAPLWPLFRHKPWQKVLRDTWAKLQKGDYDWAHLAMAYWPDRVRERCKSDKSLAISHGLEELYVEPEMALKKSRGRKKADT
ncbi:BREX-1 system adenine-specific DNA-methyltransferase PglX [Paraburkholderia sp. MMS20-SJTN17]|uniref:BREX-1 system adenine-specific DNA-methyltransferase PglX n=1 Tax=Paraburkholderia translucens TaxID=2886945 RepID=A0ABS8KBR3_9BURK|nr:BREX-1 system adenine-specific DNA-methyltransferase PglX [Paraburkholderia sp. MMS20-SJTN17]MCC8401862.1 BREX-1 system adenine-specific DNA-methyltransferase PglX [Paraburkholderia sp. MMS20-SJTN17]